MSNRKYKKRRQLVASLPNELEVMIEAADFAVAKYFDLYIPEWSHDGYRDLGGFVNAYPIDGRAPITLKRAEQLRRAHMPIMVVSCDGLFTTGGVYLDGWIFRSETWRDEWKVSLRPEDDLPDCYSFPPEALYPADTLRLLFPYRNPDGTPDMARWPTPEQFREIMKRSLI